MSRMNEMNQALRRQSPRSPWLLELATPTVALGRGLPRNEFAAQLRAANVNRPGVGIVEATFAGNLGEADAILTHTRGLPAAVATADCVPVVIEANDVVAVIHVGWRGALAGVVEQTLDVLSASATPPIRAAIGPAIGPCCYEVGTDVADRFPDDVSSTTWGTTSVDLAGFVAGRLEGLEIWRSRRCTYTARDLFSYRRDQTDDRQVAVGWLPNG